MNILYINQPLNNRGDESAHKALIRAMVKRYPQIKITVLYPRAQVEAIKQLMVYSKSVEYISYVPKWKFVFFSNIKNFKRYWWLHPTTLKIAELYKKSDLVLCAPGGISLGGFKNRSHLFFLQVAKFFNKPLAYYGRSFGPFISDTNENKKYCEESYEMLNYFSFISIRDKKTENLADEIGLNYTSTVDTAFLDDVLSEIPIEIGKQIKGKYFVFVPNLLIWHYNYKERYSRNEVKSFFIKLLDVAMDQYPDFQVLMLPQTYGYKDSDNNDVNFFYEIAKEIKSSKIIVVKDIYSSDVQQEIIKGSEFVVGARYHSIVFAINSGIPFVSLSYEHKMEGMLITLGCEERCIDITNVMDDEKSINDAIYQFKEKICNLSDTCDVRERAKAIANNCFDEFCKKMIHG